MPHIDDDCLVCERRGSMPRLSLLHAVPFGIEFKIPVIICPPCKGTGSSKAAAGPLQQAHTA